jgi:hypothetical protein
VVCFSFVAKCVAIKPVDLDFNGYAGVAQLVELQFSKLNVASSSLVARSKQLSKYGIGKRGL